MTQDQILADVDAVGDIQAKQPGAPDGSPPELLERFSQAKSIELLLSGGGFRAAMFHLGLLRAMRRFGLLSKVTRIVGVSGGAIVAAHAAVNWSKIKSKGGPSQDDGEIDAFEMKMVELSRRDIRGRILGWLLMTWVLRGVLRLASWILWRFIPHAFETHFLRLHRRLTATGMLEREFEWMFGRDPLNKALAKKNDSPEVFLLACNMNEGHLCAFSREGFHARVGAVPDEEKRDPCCSGQISLARAVAAAAAFPGFFPPLILSGRLDHVPDEVSRDKSIYLNDAGAFDNLGIELASRGTNGGSETQVLVSDATGVVRWTDDDRLEQVFGAATRAIDIMMVRAHDVQKSDFEKHADNVAFVSIGKTLVRDDGSYCENYVERVRTDIDSFSDDEIVEIFDHGYRVAMSELAKGGERAGGQPKGPAGIERGCDLERLREMERASRRSVVSWASLWRLGVTLLVLTSPLIFWLVTRLL